MNIFKKLFQLSILSTFAALIFGYLLNLLENKIGDFNLVISGGIVFLVAFLSASLGVITYSSYMDKLLEDKVEVLKSFIQSYGLGSIINEKTLTIWESTAKSIWVVTLDLVNDIGVSTNGQEIDREIVKTVSSNLKEGKHYIYFVPDIQEMKGAIEIYKQTHGDDYKNGQVKFCLIPENQFHFVNEIVLYDAKVKAKRRAVQWFPNKKLNYYLEIDEHYQKFLIGVLKTLKETYGLKDIQDID